LKRLICVTFAVLIASAAGSTSADKVNLALGKNVVTLPVASYDTEFYRNITDGNIKTFADWSGGWAKHTYFVIDLEQADHIDEIKIHCSNATDYFAKWYNLKPPLAIYTGEDLDSLKFLAEKIPFENYEYVSPEDISNPWVSFPDLNAYGRYVVIYAFRGWGVRLNEIEVLKYDKPHKKSEASSATTSLRELWLKNVSLSGSLDVSTDEITPHIKWSNPSPSGPLHVLFFMFGGHFRAIAELDQRMELDWDWVSIIWNSPEDTPAISPMTIVQEQDTLGKLAQNHDLIVLGAGVKWADLPRKVRETIIKKVEQGCGLIYVDPIPECLLPDMQEQLSKIEFSDTVAKQTSEKFSLDAVQFRGGLPHDFISFGIGENGNIARIKTARNTSRWNFIGTGFSPPLQNHITLPSPVENYYAFFMDTMYRVSGRKSSLSIVNARVQDNKLSITIDKKPVPNKHTPGLTWRCEVRDKHYDKYAEKSFRIAPEDLKDEQNQISLDVSLDEIAPHLRKGRNFFNIQLKDALGATHDFAIATFEQSSRGIAEIKQQPGGYDKQKPAEIQVLLESPVAGDIVLAKLYDGNRRLVWSDRKTIADSNSISFSMDISDVMTLAAMLEVTLGRQDVVFDRVREFVACGVNDYDDPLERYTFAVWGGGGGKPWSAHTFKQMQKAGVDASLCGGISPTYKGKKAEEGYATVAFFGKRPIINYAATVPNRLWRPGNEEKSGKILGDEEFLSQYIEHVTANVEPISKWGATSFSSGDEQQGWMSYHEKNIEAFRKFIEKKYGKNISSLNEAWGTTYKSFPEVKPIELGNIGEALSRVEMEESRGEIKSVDAKDDLKAVKGNEIYSLAPWLEYRLFMDHLFIDIHTRTRDALREINPELRFGLEGTRYAGMIGFDWPKFLENINFISCYNEPVQAEVIRTYHTRDSHTGSWVGGYDTHDQDELWAYMRSWRDLIRGLNGIFYYDAAGFRARKTSPFHRFGLVAEDLRLSHGGEIHSAQIKEIRKGIDKLILNAEQAPYTVAVRYSQSSLAAGEYIRKKYNRLISTNYLASPTAESELRAAERMMIDLGLRWRYVTDKEIEKGFLAKHDTIKLLVIPYGVCINEEEINRIKEFVNQGGTVIATGEFGVLDRRGKLHSTDFGKDIFGVKAQNNSWTIAKRKRKTTMRAVALQDSELEMPVLFDKIEIDGAEIIRTFSDDIPALIRRKAGKGSAVFVNAYLGTYTSYMPQYVPGPYHNPMDKRERLARSWRNFFRQAIGELDQLKSVKITTGYYPEDNAPYYKIEKYSNPDGVQIYGLLQESFRKDYYIVHNTWMRKGDGLDCKLKFDTTGHIYDIREKKYLGYGNEMKANIYPCEAKVYAVMPYRLKDVTLKISGEVDRGAELTMKVSVKPEGKFSGKPRSNINFEFYNPDGEEIEYYNRNLMLDGVQGQVSIKFALNDQPGTWRIKATDTVSGLSDYKLIEVK